VWSNPLAELRVLLSDQDTDRLRYRKQCLGRVAGGNLTFKTLEFHRVTDFSASGTTAPEGVYVTASGITTRLPYTAFASDDPDVGEFTIAPASSGLIPQNCEVRATYYTQWWTDADLNNALTEAANWIGLAGVVSGIEAGLRPAALYYAGQVSLHKMCIRWIENWNDVYQLEKPPQDMDAFVKLYRDMALDYQKKSEGLRKQLYTRNDQNESPLFFSIAGQVRDPMPKQ